MSKIIGVIDEPVQPGSTDNLDLKIHSKSLIDFVQQTNTPITVGIQGEWGSGKTSLLNSIYHAYSSESTFKQIWINSWEYSLLSTPEEVFKCKVGCRYPYWDSEGNDYDDDGNLVTKGKTC